MVSNDTKCDNSIPSIKAEIAKMLPGLYRELKITPQKTELGECFSICEIDTQGLEQALEKNAFPAEATDKQHHQILVDSSAKAYALSQAAPSGVQQVFKVVFSDVATRIHYAIGKLDTDDGDDTNVQLLKTRAFWVYAFWLVARKQVYLISVPPRLRELSKRLHSNPYLEEMEFIRMLDSEIKRFRLAKEKRGDKLRTRL